MACDVCKRGNSIKSSWRTGLSTAILNKFEWHGIFEQVFLIMIKVCVLVRENSGKFVFSSISENFVKWSRKL